MTEHVSSTLHLEISGRKSSQRIQHSLREGETVRIGRASQSGWPIPWDKTISRQHADLCWQNGELSVVCLPNVVNPIVYRGQTSRELVLPPGEWFQIGQTTFQLSQLEVETEVVLKFSERMDAEEHAYSENELKKVPFTNPAKQMEILSNLPQMISGSQSDADLGAALSKQMIMAIDESDAVSVAHYDVSELPESEEDLENFPKPLTMNVETREGFESRFIPSRRMILKALKDQTSVMHIWSGEGDNAEAEEEIAFTAAEGLGWAFCCPIRGESCLGWCMYVSGRGVESGGLIVTEDDLTGNLRFTELVAQFIGSIRQVRLLQDQKTQLSTFFSPKIIESLTTENASKTLEPAEREISVLFCDVRGFSKKSEMLQDDLRTLLKSVSAALGVMASGILERDGAIADFQGDAALGFWGWPAEVETGSVPACNAALEIVKAFREATNVTDSLLNGFTVGIGVAHGRALAGQIGTSRQAKVGVFGPVVNQGSRLEGLTKQFGVRICIDESSATFVKKYLPPSEIRVRRLAQVRPKGMETPLVVHTLHPSSNEDGHLADGQLESYDKAVTAVIDGQWDTARELLGQLPDDDGPKQFLLRNMADFNDTPPEDWNGAFALTSK